MQYFANERGSLGITLIGIGLVLSVIFLFGGAVYSAIQYLTNERGRTRFLGNVFIALGALLPAIGGTFTRFGYVEVLYITEFLGLSAIYFGYDMMKKDRSASVHANQADTAVSLPA
jgi:hypothetical protein